MAAISDLLCLGEDDLLRKTVKEHGAKNWKFISLTAFANTRTDVQCLHRWQKVLKPGLVKGLWTAAEDEVRCATSLFTRVLLPSDFALSVMQHQTNAFVLQLL